MNTKIYEIVRDYTTAIPNRICFMLREDLLNLLQEYNKSMAKPSSTEEYWISMGKTLAIKEFMDKEGL
jgi:hypothetical protein